MTGRDDAAWLADLANTLTEVDEFLCTPAGHAALEDFYRARGRLAAGFHGATSWTRSASPRCGCAADPRRRHGITDIVSGRAGGPSRSHRRFSFHFSPDQQLKGKH